MRWKKWALLAIPFWLLSACGSTTAPKSPPSAASPPVQVVYAGSLAYVNDDVFGPAFTRATRIPYQGRGGGSFAMAHQIASNLIPADVFESIGIQPIRQLEPAKTQWAVEVAATPLAIAYNPHSADAAFFQSVAEHKRPLRDLFHFLATHPVKLGRTNPATDPQGQAFYLMVELAAKQYDLPPDTASRILGPWNNPAQVYSEEGILTQLQAGGLDLASAYVPEAVQRHLPYIPLPASLNFSDPALASWYGSASLTVPQVGTVHGTPLGVWVTTLGSRRQGADFVAFLLQRSDLWRQAGYEPLKPTLQGQAAAVPSAVRHVLHP